MKKFYFTINILGDYDYDGIYGCSKSVNVYVIENNTPFKITNLEVEIDDSSYDAVVEYINENLSTEGNYTLTEL